MKKRSNIGKPSLEIAYSLNRSHPFVHECMQHKDLILVLVFFLVIYIPLYQVPKSASESRVYWTLIMALIKKKYLDRRKVESFAGEEKKIDTTTLQSRFPTWDYWWNLFDVYAVCRWHGLLVALNTFIQLMQKK